VPSAPSRELTRRPNAVSEGHVAKLTSAPPAAGLAISVHVPVSASVTGSAATPARTVVA
jgi:hypothetical protein